jgi:small-conductance mechanosensitive channel
MNNKNYFIIGVLLSMISLILIFLGIKMSIIVCVLGLIGLLIGIGILMYWSTISYE